RGECVPEVLAYYRRLRAGREVATRRPGVRASLLRRLIAKHRDAYEAALEDALAGMHERAEAAGHVLESFYHFAPIRAARWRRALASRHSRLATRGCACSATRRTAASAPPATRR